jgi:hypothetical protein
MQTGTQATELTREQLLARIAELEASQSKRTNGGLKVSDKGAISTYGIGRFPVTLYVSQAEKLMEIWGENYSNLKAFIEANRSKLSVKPVKE